MMNRVFIFDIDGTLTPSRQVMTEEFKDWFGNWSNKNRFYLVTGSDIEKVREQMNGLEMLAQGIFTCCGNEFWVPDPRIELVEGFRKKDNQYKLDLHCEQVYRNKFKPPETLMTYLGEQLRFSEYPNRYGNHIEDRGSLLNFSVVGRDCSYEDRIDYFEWDKKNGEREVIAQYITDQWKDIDAVIGGQISIDIYPKGNDKSQVLDAIKQHQIPHIDEYIFIGDKMEEGGNDYPLARLMDDKENCEWFEIKDYHETQKILQDYEII